MSYYPQLLRVDAAITSGVLLYQHEIQSVAVDLSTSQINQSCAELTAARIQIDQLRYHGLSLGTTYQEVKANLTYMLSQISNLFELKEKILATDRVVAQELEQAAVAVHAIYTYISSLYYQNLSLIEQQTYISSQRSLFAEYFNGLNVKINAYFIELTRLNRDYDAIGLSLNEYDTLSHEVTAQTIRKKAKVEQLFRELNALNQQYHRINFSFNLLSKRINELAQLAVATKNFYCSSSQEHAQATDDFADFTMLLSRVESGFKLIKAMITEMECNYTRFLNTQYLHSLDAYKYDAMHKTFKQLIAGFLLISGDNTDVVKDRKGIYTVNIDWPSWPEREKYTVVLPTPQVVLYELPSNACPVTCGQCGGDCPQPINSPKITNPPPTPTSTTTTTQANGTTTTTTTTTTTAAPNKPCKIILKDINDAQRIMDDDIDCYIDGHFAFTLVGNTDSVTIYEYEFLKPGGNHTFSFKFKKSNRNDTYKTISICDEGNAEIYSDVIKCKSDTQVGQEVLTFTIPVNCNNAALYYFPVVNRGQGALRADLLPKTAISYRHYNFGIKSLVQETTGYSLTLESSTPFSFIPFLVRKIGSGLNFTKDYLVYNPSSKQQVAWDAVSLVAPHHSLLGWYAKEQATVMTLASGFAVLPCPAQIVIPTTHDLVFAEDVYLLMGEATSAEPLLDAWANQRWLALRPTATLNLLANDPLFQLTADLAQNVDRIQCRVKAVLPHLPQPSLACTIYLALVKDEQFVFISSEGELIPVTLRPELAYFTLATVPVFATTNIALLTAQSFVFPLFAYFYSIYSGFNLTLLVADTQRATTLTLPGFREALLSQRLVQTPLSLCQAFQVAAPQYLTQQQTGQDTFEIIYTQQGNAPLSFILIARQASSLLAEEFVYETTQQRFVPVPAELAACSLPAIDQRIYIRIPPPYYADYFVYYLPQSMLGLGQQFFQCLPSNLLCQLTFNGKQTEVVFEYQQQIRSAYLKTSVSWSHNVYYPTQQQYRVVYTCDQFDLGTSIDLYWLQYDAEHKLLWYDVNLDQYSESPVVWRTVALLDTTINIDFPADLLLARPALRLGFGTTGANKIGSSAVELSLNLGRIIAFTPDSDQYNDLPQYSVQQLRLVKQVAGQITLELEIDAEINEDLGLVLNVYAFAQENDVYFLDGQELVPIGPPVPQTVDLRRLHYRPQTPTVKSALDSATCAFSLDLTPALLLLSEFSLKLVFGIAPTADGLRDDYTEALVKDRYTKTDSLTFTSCSLYQDYPPVTHQLSSATRYRFTLSGSQLGLTVSPSLDQDYWIYVIDRDYQLRLTTKYGQGAERISLIDITGHALSYELFFIPAHYSRLGQTPDLPITDLGCLPVTKLQFTLEKSFTDSQFNDFSLGLTQTEASPTHFYLVPTTIFVQAPDKSYKTADFSFRFTNNCDAVGATLELELWTSPLQRKQLKIYAVVLNVSQPKQQPWQLSDKGLTQVYVELPLTVVDLLAYQVWRFEFNPDLLQLDLDENQYKLGLAISTLSLADAISCQRFLLPDFCLESIPPTVPECVLLIPQHEQLNLARALPIYRPQATDTQQDVLDHCALHFDYWQTTAPQLNVFSQFPHWIEAKSRARAIAVTEQGATTNQWEYVPYGSCVLEGFADYLCYRRQTLEEDWHKPVFSDLEHVLNFKLQRQAHVFVWCQVQRLAHESVTIWINDHLFADLATNIFGMAETLGYIETQLPINSAGFNFRAHFHHDGLELTGRYTQHGLKFEQAMQPCLDQTVTASTCGRVRGWDPAVSTPDIQQVLDTVIAKQELVQGYTTFTFMSAVRCQVRLVHEQQVLAQGEMLNEQFTLYLRQMGTLYLEVLTTVPFSFMFTCPIPVAPATCIISKYQNKQKFVLIASNYPSIFSLSPVVGEQLDPVTHSLDPQVYVELNQQPLSLPLFNLMAESWLTVDFGASVESVVITKQ